VAIEKTLRKVVNAEEQDLETYRYWQSQPVGARLSAVWDASEAAYSFAASFKGASIHDDQRYERPLTRFQCKRG
jgi:hypothetical protein